MLPYFSITGFVAILAIVMPARRVSVLLWTVAFFFIVVFVGLRHHVGMDWNNYLRMIEFVGRGTLYEALEYAEPAFALLLWLSAQLGFGIYGSNLVGTLVFCVGLFCYARSTPSPWVTLVVAMPMLVTVVAMSANRQAVAIGVLLWLVAVWYRSTLSHRIAAILLASMFHASALVFLVFVMSDLKFRWSIRIGSTVIFMIAALFLMEWTGRADHYDAAYVTGQSEFTRAPGAVLHILFNGGPAALYFLLSKRRQSILLPDQLHRNMAMLAIALLPTAFFFSAAAGRISLYLFPVSMYIFSSLPNLASSKADRQLIRTSIAISMIGLLYLWLGFANSSIAHLPYGNLLTTPFESWRLCC